MSAIQQLLTDHIDIWTAAETEKRSGRGRASGNAASMYGIKKLRELILELAVRGKLVPQDTNDESASDLLKRIQVEKKELITKGKIKKDTQSPHITEKEKPFTLPHGWTWSRFGDALINRDAERIPVSSDDRQNRKGEFDYYGASGVIDKIDKYLFDKPLLLIGEDGANLINRSSPIAFIARGKYWVNNHAHVLDGISENFLRYIELYINAIDLKPYVTGTAQPKMNQAKMNSIILALPSEEEQNRIIAKVDELMALCDQLEAQHSDAANAHEQLVSHLLGTLTQSQSAADFNTNWQRIAAHFDTLFTTEASIDALKQTMLQLAVMGKLVAQDADDEPASELLKRIQAEKAKLIAEGKIKKDKQVAAIGSDEKPFELPQNWEWVSFDHIAENSKHALKAGPFGSALKKNMHCENGYKIYGQEQVISGDESLGDYYINEEKFRELSSCAVKSGDILISLVGTIGRVLVLSEKCEEGIINPRLVKISLFNEINRYFMKIIFASPLLKNEMANKSHGGTMDILNLGLLRAFALPLPPINEQHRIVTKVDELMECCDQLRSRITAGNQQQKKLADVLVEHAVIG